MAGLPAASTRSNRSSSSVTTRRPSALGRWCRSVIRRRFSSPVNWPSTAVTWPVSAIEWRTRSGSRATSNPATSASPASAEIKVEMMWIAVVLPAPFGPSRANTEPAGTSRSIPSRTTCLPYDLRRPRTRIAGAAVAVAVIGHLPGLPGGARAQMSSSSTVGWREARATMSKSSGGTFSRSSSRVGMTSMVDSFGAEP